MRLKHATNAYYAKMLSQNLLDILVCPLTKDKLKYDKKNNELISEKAKLAYQIKDGIPNMLVEEARKLTK